MSHVAVLLNEVVEGLDPKPDETFVDATLGAGGHSLAIYRQAPGIRIIGLDADALALRSAESKLVAANCEGAELVKSNFRRLGSVLAELGIQLIDKALFDLGTSTDQLSNSGRGFSFQHDEPLLMTLDNDPVPGALTAKEIVNQWTEEQLATIIYGYGEEKFSRPIAKKIVEARQEDRIETTYQLVAVIKQATPKWYQHRKIHFATKTFQALRIAVNDELTAIEEGVGSAWQHLRKKGRLAVISFHSLEDRIIKKMFREWEDHGLGQRINKKTIVASKEEIRANSRSRSAKLRLIEKLV